MAQYALSRSGAVSEETSVAASLPEVARPQSDPVTFAVLFMMRPTAYVNISLSSSADHRYVGSPYEIPRPPSVVPPGMVPDMTVKWEDFASPHASLRSSAGMSSLYSSYKRARWGDTPRMCRCWCKLAKHILSTTTQIYL